MPLHIVADARRIRDFGIGTYIRNLLHALSQIDRENRYSLVIPAADAAMFSSLPPNFELAPFAGVDDSYRDHIAFPWFLRQFGADLYHIPLNRVPLLMPKPYVVTIHDMSSLLFHTKSGLRIQLRRWRFRRGLARARKVIAVSEATSRAVQDELGIPPDRIRIVYNAPDPQFFARPETADEERRILERYQIHYPFLLYVGNIRPQKNIPRLVEAFAVARQQLQNHPVYGDLRLIIIGDEISRNPAVRRAVLHSRVGNCARFLGFVPLDALRVFYSTAAAFVFPSLYEGFGLPPLEAMAAGTPVVTSNISSLPEAVGDSAVLVNPENVFDIARGIREVLLDEDLRARLIEGGLRRAATFSWERTARDVLAIYQEICGRM